MTATKIEWTHRDGTEGMTWNPIRGCTKVSPGCDNCYAMEIAHRFSGPGKPFEGLTRKLNGRGQWNGKVRLVPEKLAEPVNRVTPTTYFVNSMSDLFHESVPFEFISKVFSIMGCTTRHTYQVLTKRPDRMLEFFKWRAEYPEGDLSDPWNEDVDKTGWPDEIPWTPATKARGGYDTCGPVWPLENVWLGISAEDRQRWDERIDYLRQCPATVRFVSAEPLLGPLGVIDLSGIHWVIVGGESGRLARQCRIEWICSIVDQCQNAGVPVFVKQLGAVPEYSTDGSVSRAYIRLSLRDRKGSDPSEWPADLRVREWPA